MSQYTIHCAEDPACGRPAREYVICRSGVVGPVCYHHRYDLTQRKRDKVHLPVFRLDPELDAAPRPDCIELLLLEALANNGNDVIAIEWAVVANYVTAEGRKFNSVLTKHDESLTNARALVRFAAEARRDGGDDDA